MEKLALKINTGDTPDLFFYLTGQPEYINWGENGIVLDLDQYLDKAPNMKKLLGNELYENLKVNGHYYFVPVVTQANNQSIYYRKDWLDKLNLKEPTNIEEFTAMLKAFTEGDPDGNNKKDTVGLTGSKIRDWFNIIFAGFGVKPEWNKNANGVFEAGYATEAYKHSGAKADGVIKQIGAVNSSAVVDSLTPPDGLGGKGGVFSFGGYWGGWSISSQTKDKEKAVQMLDYLYSPEGRNLTYFGIEGVHYKKDGDNIVANLENRGKEPQNTFDSIGGELSGLYKFGQYFGSLYQFNGNKLEALSNNTFNKNREIADKQDVFINKNLIMSDVSNVMDFPVEFGEPSKKMTDIMEKYKVMIISGEIVLDVGWTQMNSELNAVGYAKAQQYVKETMDKLK